MKIRILLAAILLAVGLSAAPGLAQPVYRAGDIIENVTLINRRTGQPMQLTDFAGKILFLDFFAHWCPVCNAAAPQLEAGIYQRYREAGNAAGLPVVYVLCNLQGDFTPRDIAGTDTFTGRFGSDAFVLQDNNRALQHRFTSASGQPTFAVINGVANSPSHRQWELVYSLHGYTSPGRVQPIGEFQAAIDSVQAPSASVPVQITAQPQSQSALVGATVSLTVTATGSAPIQYQWQKNGVGLEGATSPTLTFANVQASDAGSYRVTVHNTDSSVTSDLALLTVIEPVTITAHPQGGVFPAGTALTLTVTAIGTTPLAYRWKRNDVELPGAVEPSLGLENLQPSDAGDYQVAVSNAGSSVTSALATVTVAVPPVIVSQPESRTVIERGIATFTVVVNGSAPLDYQWRFNGASIPNARDAMLTLDPVRVSDAGQYTVLITNPAGSVTSAPATLTVEAAVETPITLTNARRAADGAFEFEFLGTPGRIYRIEVSENLEEWNTLAIVTAGTVPQLVRDAAVITSLRRYYRIESE